GILLRKIWNCGCGAALMLSSGFHGDSPLRLLSYVTLPGFPPSVMLEMTRSCNVGNYKCG
ncbi:hypothetical protein GOODEAATRI_018670, partial [Goodea atripinnis]